MSKPRKVEEPAGTYSASSKRPVKPSTPESTQPAIRYARSEDVRKVNVQLMQVHRKVLQKLAQ